MRRVRARRPADVAAIGNAYATVNLLREKLAASKLAVAQLPTTETDFVVNCGDYSWTFHRAAFEGKSEFFQTMLRSEFREAKQGVINLDEEEPQLLVRLFQFVYTDKYALLNTDEIVPGFSVNIACQRGWKHEKEDLQLPVWDETFCELHLNMFIMGDYFMMPELQEYALKELRDAVYLVISLETVFECIEALEEPHLENMPSKQFDRIVTAIKKGLSRRDNVKWTSAQTAKIRELAKKLPSVGELA